MRSVVKYSICMSNYNMADTIERSLTTILEQLDGTFEVVVVDDGSTDDSLRVLKSMQSRYANLRVVPLRRERKRKLGLTRNISIKEAAGDYVLLHLDCDDIYGPYLKDFTIAFHQIEKCLGKDILLSGQHINMGKKDFLLQHGPYKNIFRGEDRNLWHRLAAIEAYIPFDHVDFVTRLPKTAKKRFMRSFYYTWDHLVNDFRAGSSISEFLQYEVLRKKDMTLKLRIYRMLILLPAYFMAKFEEPLLPPATMKTPQEFNEYRTAARGNLETILNRHGCRPDWSVFSANARQIFG